MRRLFIPYKLLIILLSFWLLLTFNFSLFNIFIGLVICSLVLIASKGVLYSDNGYIFKRMRILAMVKYLFNLLLEIYKSSFSYIVRIIKKDCEPFIVEVELDVTDPLIISIISNSITLTPGTLTIDVQNNKLTVLTLKDCEDCISLVDKEIKEKFQSFFVEKG
ncbi:Na+/H+ antiporter subunit E [Wukongibacter baidiensis]|uniref:Na+/H+ antiporter subunit E n=1 Tax=Wukongibacter baidiensis TaxID=1723361 RepID=UPI003D7F6A00